MAVRILQCLHSVVSCGPSCTGCVAVSSQGSEPLPSVSRRADRSNGYVKGSKAVADTQPQASEMVSVVHTETYFLQ